MSSKNEKGIMYVTLSSYLRALRAEESRKSEEERLSVPTMKMLAEVAGIKPSSLSSIVNGRTRSFNFDACASIITEMRRRGFKTEITDIFKFEIPGESKPKRSLPPPLTRHQRFKFPGEEFVKAYASDSDDEASLASVWSMQLEMPPEITEVMRMLTSFPDPIQKDTVSVLREQLELIQKTLSFHDQLPQK